MSLATSTRATWSGVAAQLPMVARCPCIPVTTTSQSSRAGKPCKDSASSVPHGLGISVTLPASRVDAASARSW